MGKFQGRGGEVLKKINHPILVNKELYVPESYRFYDNQAEKEKWQKTLDWLRIIEDWIWHTRNDLVIDAFAGVGVLTTLYLYFGYPVFAIEKNPILASALWKNVKDYSAPAAREVGDSAKVLALFEDSDPRVKIIDLDPFGSCLPQIREAARVLKRGFLFVTAGDIYAGSRFKGWGFTEKRYGTEFFGPAKDYPKKVIYPYIQKEFQKFGKSTKLLDCFSFPTICRLFVGVSRTSS